MAVKKKTPTPLSSFDDLDSAGIGIGYQPMSFADEPAVVAAPEKQTLARRVGDTAVQFGQGAVTGVKMMSDVFGANNAVSSGLGDVNQALDGLLSATAQNDKQKVAKIMQEAEGKGWGEQIIAGLKAAGVDPVGLAANALGTSLPTMATMLIPGAGPVAVATRMGAGVAMGAGQGVGAVKGQIYDETKRKWLESGATPDQAEAKAQEAAAYGGANTDQMAIGGVLGMGSVLGAERALGKVLHGASKAGPGMLGRVATSTLAETGTEMLQGGQEKFATNTALNRQGFDVDPMSGVIANATLEGAAAAPMGAVAGIPKPAVAAAPGIDPAKEAADTIRATETVPESGPMTRASNAATEAKAQAIEAGAPLVDEQATAEPMPEPVDDPVRDQILALPDGARQDALRAYAVVNRTDVAKGVQQYNRKLLDRLLTENAPPPVLGESLTGTDMGTMLGGGGMAGNTDPLMGALGMGREAQANSITNVANVAERRPPMPASDAARMLDEARNQGVELAVAEHPAGGFVLVPPNWVTPDMAAQGEARLNETIARMQQADAAPVERAPRTRTDGVGLNLQTDPVQNYLDNLRGVNTPAAHAYVRDFDAGRITPTDVQQRMQAEKGLTPEQRIARAAAEAPAQTDPVADRLARAAAQGAAVPAPTDILNPVGLPFKTRMAADRAAKQPPGAVVPVEGGFVVRPQESVNVQDVPQTPEVPQAAPAISQPGQAPQAVGARPASPAAGVPAEGAGAVEAAGVAPATTRIGRDQTPLSEGGKPFKTRKAAGDAKKLQPMMRVVTVPGGYALAEKTPAQLAAEERAAKRLRTPRTSPAGEPVPAHAFIAASGGLHMRHRNDLGVDGNPRIGNRRLFGGLNRGLSIEQATEMLVADGYLSEGASHNDAYALIKKSLSQPQYNADGIERIAQAESDAQFEDYMAAQEEAADEGDMDPFDMAGEFTSEELDDVGYASASPALQAEVNALIAQADAMDIDTYAILEDIARTYANATQDQYNAAAREAIAAAIARGNSDGGSTAAQAAPAAEPAAEQGLNRPEAPANQAQVAAESVAPPALELAAQTPAEAAARQDAQEQADKAEAAAKRAEDAAAKAEEERKRIAQASVRAADRFELGQDPMDSLTGQGSMFDDAPAQQAPTTAVVDDDGRERFTLSIEMFGDVPYRASKPVDAGNGDVVSSRVITTKTKLTAANAQSLGLPKDKGTVYAWRVSVIRRADGAAHSVIEAMATDNGRSPDGEVLAHFKEVENPEAMERIAPAIANAALSDWRAAQPQQAPTTTEAVAQPITRADVTAAQQQAGDGITIKPGKGLIKGKFLAEVDGDGVPGGPWDTEQKARTAAEAWKQTTADRATEDAAERARRGRIADKFRAGEVVTNAEIESLGLKTGSSDMRWFMSTAANLFGLNSRDIRPLVKDLIRTSLTDMGAKREFVPTRQALEAIAKSQAEGAPMFSRAPAGGQTETAAFKRWFGDSKVVDAEGKPLVMYHGTLADFSEFDGKGLYFVTPSAEFSEKFTKSEDGGFAEGAKLMPVYVKASNPFDYENKKHVDIVSRHAYLQPHAVKEVRQGKWQRIEDRTIIAAIKKSGFDGIYVNEEGVKNLAVFDPSQIKSATGNNGQFDQSNPDIRFSFAGARAATADKHALVTAQDRLSAGEDAETVRQETGWFQGKDGKWRFEISDAGAQLAQQVYFAERGKWYPSRFLADARDHGSDTGGTGTLGDVLEHPALFAAYPALRDMPVTAKIRKDQESGAFDGRFITATAENEGRLLSVLLHEIQHGIQNIEGFATGGSIESARAMQADAQSNAFNQAQGAWHESRKRWPSAYKSLMDQRMLDGRLYDKYDIKTMDEDGNQRKAIVLAFELRKKISEADKALRSQAQLAYNDAVESELGGFGSDAFNEFNRLYSAVTKAFEGTAETATSVYKRLAGEVEARNTQARQGMTDAQRRATPPNQTADVADSEVIVVFNGKEMENAPEPANAEQRLADAKQQLGTPVDPYQHKLQAIQAARKQAANVVQADNGQWLLAPKAEPYTAQEARDAQQRIDKLNRALGKYSSVAPAAVLSDAPTAAMAWGRSVARTLGYNVTFIRPNPDFHGVAVGGDAFVSASAEHPEIGLIGHEVLHSFKQSDPGTYEALAERIRPYLKNGVVDAKRKWEDARGGQNTSMAMAEEEVFADLNGAMWLDPLFWREMASNDPSLFRQVAYKFMEVATKAMKGLSRFKADTLVTDVDAVRKIIAQEWATQAQEMGNPSEFSETDGPAFSRATATDTKAFRDWFKGSKVVDAQTGKPLVVYHGTAADIDAFDLAKSGSLTRARSADGAFWFSDSPELAGDYAALSKKKLGKNGARNVMPVFLKMENPKIVDMAGKSYHELAVDFGAMVQTARKGVRSGTDWVVPPHDGMILRNFSDTPSGRRLVATHYVAFHPEQIKSATGNRGAFDPANPDIRFSRTTAQSIASSMGDMTPDQEKAYKNVAGVKAVPTVRERMDALKANLGLKLRQGLVDQFAAIKQLDQNAYVQARMSKGTDGTLEAILMYGKPFMRDGAPDVDVKDGGFAKVLASLKGEQDRWMMWIAAQRAEKLKAEGKENLMTDDDISALKTLNAGKMADGTARMPIYAKALAELNDYNDAMLKLAMDSGLIDQAAYDLMAGQPYVPFYRLMEDGDMKGPKFSSGLTNQKAWQKLKGGSQQLNADLLQNMLLNWSHLLQASAKNRAATATMDAAEKMAVAYKVAADTKGAVKVMRDGSAEHWMVEDPYLLDAISAIHYVPSPLMKPLAKFKQLLTWGVTVNPTFKIRNLIRDSVSAIAQSELGYNPAANVAKGWKLTAKDSQIYASMLASGGLIKFGTQENTDQLRAQVAKLGGVVLDKSGAERFFGQIKDLYDVYNEFGDRAENVNRAALYDALIKKGKTHAEAAFMARDLMDFSMGGSAPVVRFLTQTVPFLNARLVGLDKLGRAAIEDPRRFAAVTGAVALASLALMAGYSDDEDWKKREDWDRDAYWWFKIGGQAYRIPKPFEVGAIGTLAERTAELMFNDEMTGKRYMERVSHMLSGTFSFNPVPQAFKPLLDLYANKDSFTGRAIESQADQRLRPQDRYSERTPEVAKFLGGLGLPDPAQLVKGEYSALSPKQVEHLVRGYFSWVGTAAMTVSDLGLRPLAGRGERPDMRLKDVFIAGNFVENLPTGSSRYVTQMYEQSRQVEQAYASYQEAIKAGDTEKAQSIKESAGPLLRNRPAYTAATRQLAEINRTAKRIEADQAMAGAAKRARLTELEQQRQVVAQRVSRLATATP